MVREFELLGFIIIIAEILVAMSRRSVFAAFADPLRTQIVLPGTRYQIHTVRGTGNWQVNGVHKG